MNLRELVAGVTRAEFMFWAITLAVMVLFLYPGDERTFVQHFADPAADPAWVQYQSYLFHHGMTFLILTTALLLLRPAGIARYGMGLFAPGDWRWGLKWTLIACAVVTGPTWVSSRDPQFLAEYPLAPFAFTDPSLLALFLFSYVLYYVGWESFYRGFIGFGMTGLGYTPFLALMVQVSLSTIIHIGKPQMELIGAIPGGILMGVLAWRSRSLLWPFLFHVYVGFINTWFCWVHRA